MYIPNNAGNIRSFYGANPTVTLTFNVFVIKPRAIRSANRESIFFSSGTKEVGPGGRMS